MTATAKDVLSFPINAKSLDSSTGTERIEKLIQLGETLTPSAVKALEDLLPTSPDALKIATALYGFYKDHIYEPNKYLEGYVKLTSRVINMFPTSFLAGQMQYYLEDKSFDLLVDDWLKQVDLCTDSTVVLDHAASFCQFSRRDISEKLWSRARELAPDDIWFSYQLAKLYRSYLHDELAVSKSYFERSLQEWLAVLAIFEKNSTPNGKGAFLNSYLLEQDSIKFAEEAVEQKFYYQAKVFAYRLLRSKNSPRGFANVQRKHIAWSIIGRIQLAEGDSGLALKQLSKMISSAKLDDCFINDVEVKLANELLLRGFLEEVVPYAECCVDAYRRSMAKIPKHISKIIARRIEVLNTWLERAQNAHALGNPFTEPIQLPEF